MLLVEHEHAVGGHLRYSSRTRTAPRWPSCGPRLDASDVEVLTDSTVTGRYEDNWLGIVQRNHPIAVERLIKARAKVLVVAPGLIERPYVFSGNDRPGVITSGAVRRLINLWGVKPGERAVVFTANSEGDAAAADLDRVGVEVAAVVDGREGRRVSSAQGSIEGGGGGGRGRELAPRPTCWSWPRAGPLPLRCSTWPATGRSTTRQPPASSRRTRPATCWPPAGWPATAPSTTAGPRRGHRTPGRTAGRCGGSPLQALTARARPVDGDEPSWAPDERTPLGRDSATRSCTARTPTAWSTLSEDVGSKDLVAAAREGYDSVELAKRFTTATMGPSQGKLETVNTVAAIAEARGETIAQVGTTVWRPPYAPLTPGRAGRAGVRAGAGVVDPSRGTRPTG